MTDWTDDDFSFFDDADDVITSRKLKASLRHDRRIVKRQFIADLKHQALISLVSELPPPDTDIYLITNGLGAEAKLNEGKSPGFATFIPFVVEQLGGSNCHAYISTWAISEDHILMLLNMLDTGQIKHLSYFTDQYFFRRSPGIASQLIDGLQSRGQCIKLWKNHTKIIAIANESETRACVVMSSANMNAQPRAEQITITTSLEAYHWIKTDFFEAILTVREHQPKYRRTRKPKTPPIDTEI